MKKTVFINLAGTTFLIDEDAYEVMNLYLDKLNKHFNGQEGALEIIKDIEGRIAELFIEERIKEDRSINIATANRVIDQLGDPSLFDDEEDQENVNEAPTPQKPSKKLFRYPQRGIIGGVLAGISVYLNVNVAILRLLFILSCLFAGSGILIYILLWIIIPKARTRINYMQMKGIPPTVENIQKYSQEIDEEMMFRNSGSGCLKWLFGIILFLCLLPFFIVLLVMILLLPLLMVFPSIIGNHMVINGTNLTMDALHFSSLESAAVAGLFVIPLIIILIYKLKSIDWDLNTKRWVSVFLIILWIGCGIQTFKGVNHYLKQFNNNSFKGVSWSNFADRSFSQSTIKQSFNYVLKSHPDTLWIKEKKEIESEGELVNISKLNITKHKSNNLALQIKAGLSEGHLENAKMYYELKGDTLLLSTHIYEGDPMVEELYFKLKLPVGRTIFIDKSLSNTLDDVKNIDNTWDYEMVDKFWKQTPKGLKNVSK
ncbi:PspC domain-containing protein [Halosquirtibacter xylanolyticus]|uniref:PspC domain-containing protein n=1 Tax=Halosquirtibacter xylanolyticus TaxID=3374599 RepID=UPI00374805FE|nr:PspC domain-containing protein [Prolixibacteraceae bacterium]